MERIGRVEKIINDEYLLIFSNVSLGEDELCKIVGEIKEVDCKDLDIDTIFYPKGEIRVSLQQKENIYLARRFRGEQERTKIVEQPSSFSVGISQYFRSFSGTRTETLETVPGPWSAVFNQEESLKVAINTIVSIGDIVVR